MQITRSIAETRIALRSLRASGATLALVPTMGALHAGHMSLVSAAQSAADRVAVSIFVNPLQFAPTEDLARYPRTFAADCDLLAAANVDLLFAPAVTDIYPHGQSAVTTVDVPELSSRLDGASRPGHFRGVATVVAKLFNIVQPDFAFFGQKDAAQVAVLRRMVRDLDIPVYLRVEPTVRESDGLALSSRNRYLSPAERTSALALSRALHAAQHQIATKPGTDPAALEQLLREHIAAEPGLRLDYAAVVSPDSLEPVRHLQQGALLAVAAWAGATRLIDNLLLPPTSVAAAPLLTATEPELAQAETSHG